MGGISEENVEWAVINRLKAMLATIEIQVVLTGQLVSRIRRQRCFRGVFNNRLTFAVITVDRSTGSENNALDACLAHGFAHVQGADEVTLVGTHRVVNRGLHRSNCCQVNHSAATGHDFGNQCGVSHVAFNQFDPRVVHWQVAAFACGHVIENSYGVALGQQGVYQVGANKTGTTGD